jgi:hypothetical protein
VTHRLTRLFIAAALGALPAHAFALDFTPDASRILSDPLYLPLQGQFTGVTDYDFSVSTGHIDDALGAKLSSFDIRTNRILQSFAYGVTDDFTLGISDSYDPLRERLVTTASGTTQRDSSGLEDPTVSAIWRMLDQGTNPVSLDLLASYSPDLVDAQTASLTSDGSVARGGQQLSFGAGLGHETKDFTIRAGLDANWFGRRKVEDDAGATVSSLGSFWNYSADLSTQTRLTDRISFDAGASYVFARDASLANHLSGIDFESRPGDATGLHMGINYHVVPNQFVVGLTYGYNTYDTGKDTSAATPSADIFARDRKENVVGAKLDYTFE